MSKMFYHCGSLQSMDISTWNLENLELMEGTFSNCKKLKEIKFPENFTAAKNMSNVFYNCWSLEEIDFSNWNTEKTEDISNMLSGCEKLKIILYNPEKTYFENAVNLERTFSGCKSLEELDLSQWNADFAENMKGIFSSCPKLKQITFAEKFGIAVKDLSEAFKGCESLEYVDISNFYLENVKNISGFFNGCKNLKYVEMPKSNPTIAQNSLDEVFVGCPNLDYVDLLFLYQLQKITL